nr:hypothetical protein [uncultured Noviherbaspirillum sp.]
MVTTINSPSAISNNKPFAPDATASETAVDSPAKAAPPGLVPIALLILQTYQILSGRIGANADLVNASLKQKTAAISSCLELLNGLNAWNTPPIVPKNPSDPLDPASQDRVDKTNALYLNGVSIPDGDLDAVTYTYGNPPKNAYSALPIPEVAEKDLDGSNLVVGQLYRVAFVITPPAGGADQIFKKDLVYGGKGVPGMPAKSPIKLKAQNGTDFSTFAPGDLVQDRDTGRYYRVAKDKTGVEVTGYPLQKFVRSPDVDTSASLKAQINQKITASSDLSKADSLEIQRLQGFLSTVVTMCIDLASTNISARNAIVNTRM